MLNVDYSNLTLSLLFFITIAIYVLIIIIFMTARKKYKGGVIEKVINLIISTIGFLLVADIALLMAPLYGFNISYQVHVVFKIIAMTLLATGGLKFFIR